jgi:hypothetical protein
VKPIVKEQYPDAEKAALGKDNANPQFENTHTVLSLYEAVPAAEAFELAQSWKSIIRPSMAVGLT